MAHGHLHKIAALLLTALSLGFHAGAQESCDQALDCFSIIVGKKASADGSVLFAHNEDTGLGLVNYYKVPAADHQPGEEIILKNGGKLPQVTHTFSYFWINLPVCDVCDSYVNEYGVSVGSDGCPSREENPELTDGGIVFWLRRVVAERARTAREGVEMAGSLIEKYGYASSGRSYIIADAKEAWVLCAVNGKHWVAQRVPDDKIVIIANCFTMQGVNLKDTANFKGSPDLIDYATRQGWYNPAKHGEFNFSKAYSNPGSLNHPGNLDRMWRGADLLAVKNYDPKGDFPFLLDPVKKLTIQDIMKVLRDHYEGSALDLSRNYTEGNPHRMNNATICSGGSQYGFIAHLRSWMPVEIGTLVWLAPYRPDVQAFCPWYPAMKTVPAIYGHGDHHSGLTNQFHPTTEMFDRKNGHAFWAFVGLVEKIDKDYGNLVRPVQAEWKAYETKAFNDTEKIEKIALDIYKKNPQKALDLLTAYSSTEAMKILKKTRKL